MSEEKADVSTDDGVIVEDIPLPDMLPIIER
jgi:hypothetical protein